MQIQTSVQYMSKNEDRMPEMTQSSDSSFTGTTNICGICHSSFGKIVTNMPMLAVLIVFLAFMSET